MHRVLDPALMPVGDESRLIERFDAIAAMRPDDLAIIAGGERITFAELRSWSTCIADAVGCHPATDHARITSIAASRTT